MYSNFYENLGVENVLGFFKSSRRNIFFWFLKNNLVSNFRSARGIAVKIPDRSPDRAGGRNCNGKPGPRGWFGDGAGLPKIKHRMVLNLSQSLKSRTFAT